MIWNQTSVCAISSQKKSCFWLVALMRSIQTRRIVNLRSTQITENRFISGINPALTRFLHCLLRCHRKGILLLGSHETRLAVVEMLYCTSQATRQYEQTTPFVLPMLLDSPSFPACTPSMYSDIGSKSVYWPFTTTGNEVNIVFVDMTNLVMHRSIASQPWMFIRCLC